MRSSPSCSKCRTIRLMFFRSMCAALSEISSVEIEIWPNALGSFKIHSDLSVFLSACRSEGVV